MRDSVNEIKVVSWSTDGSTFVVGGKGPYMRQFSASGEPIMDIPGNEDDISDIVAIQHYGSNSESMFIADNTSRQVRRWDFASTSFAQTCQTHDNDIACIATRKGGEIALYNLVYNTRTELRSATHRAMLSMDFSASARTQLMVGSEDGLLQLFDATRYGEAPAKTFAHVHSAPVCALKFHPANLNYVVSAGLDGKMVLTDTVVQRSNAISVMAEAHLRALRTIDGDVLVYDLRGSRTPLWKHRVATRKPLVSIDFAFEQSAMPVATGRRPSGVTMSSRVVGREPRLLVLGRPNPRSVTVRPPHNPAIKAHHRQVLNQLLESAHKKEPRSSNALGITSRQETEEKALPVAHGHMKYAEDPDLPVQHDELEQMHATGPDADQHHLEDFDDEFDFSPAEPLRYAEPAEDEAAEERHDMGDSMMEMFTPEREKPPHCPRPPWRDGRIAAARQDTIKDGQQADSSAEEQPEEETTIDLAEPQESRKPAPSLKTPGRANEFSAISPRSARSIEKRRQAQMLEYERDFEPMPKRRAVQGFERTPRVANEPKSAKRSAVRFLSRAPPKYSKESVEEDLVPRTGTKSTSKYTPKPWMRHVGLPSRRQEVEEKEPPAFAAVAKRHETKVARPLVRQVDRSLDEEIREKQRPSYRADPEPAVEEEEEEEDKQEYVGACPENPSGRQKN
ncbi:WD40 repeat-like protein [Linderina pennispora]|uniref:WD40 repeat-like protein n=1 Tax=Linderina pennispora TaxID=61395 RepID=A0A1Y1VPU8_9FUNG|nr:WD40 repeat-like protein [Linderina pennispora]ORX63338.1 WD40 repeat-like protein [Linderina pennispora]